MLRTLLPSAVRFCVESLLIVLGAAVLSAVLFRAAPGSEVDLLEASPQISDASKAALRQQRASVHALAGTSISYYQKVLHGDFGVSETSGRPVSELLSERIPPTVTLVCFGSAFSLAVALALAAWSATARSRRFEWLLAIACSSLLAIPSGVVGLLAIALRIPVELALVAIVVPRLYAYCSKLIAELLRSDYVLAAQCQGVPPGRIFLRHLLPAALPELCGMYSLSMVTSLGVCIALEVFGARPGLGELAWQSALNRDMPVVLGVTIVVVILVRFGMNISNLFFAVAQRHVNAKVADNALDTVGDPLYLRA